ncbi:MAG TPA: NADH-quinone oxidoreductase subunit C [Coriobacteriia bacterium]|jgi:NADH-quinone oxidoreductase subunit C
MMRPELTEILARHGVTFHGLGFDPRADVARADWRACAAELRAAGARFFDITAIDRGEAVEMILVLVDPPAMQFEIRTSCPNEDLRADSLSGVFPPAEWGEREVFDLFGVVFDGNPDMTRILQPESSTIFPLRRSFILEERPW